jgi:HSP20 family protein
MMQREDWAEMASLENRIEALFRSLGWPTRHPAGLFGGHTTYSPPTDVFERNGDLVVRIDLPGIDPDKDVNVRVEEDNLIVRGERKEQAKVENKDFYRVETMLGTFQRRIPLPHGANPEKITAAYQNGVLEIVAHEARKELPTRKSREIAVKTQSQLAGRHRSS